MTCWNLKWILPYIREGDHIKLHLKTTLPKEWLAQANTTQAKELAPCNEMTCHNNNFTNQTLLNIRRQGDTLKKATNICHFQVSNDSVAKTGHTTSQNLHRHAFHRHARRWRTHYFHHATQQMMLPQSPITTAADQPGTRLWSITTAREGSDKTKSWSGSSAVLGGLSSLCPLASLLLCDGSSGQANVPRSAWDAAGSLFLRQRLASAVKRPSAFENAPVVSIVAFSGQSLPYKQRSHTTNTRHHTAVFPQCSQIQNLANGELSNSFWAPVLANLPRYADTPCGQIRIERSGRCWRLCGWHLQICTFDGPALTSAPPTAQRWHLQLRRSSAGGSPGSMKTRRTVFTLINVAESKNRVLRPARGLLPAQIADQSEDSTGKSTFLDRRETRKIVMVPPTCPLLRGNTHLFTKATEVASAADPVKVGWSLCAMAPHSIVYLRCQRRDVTWRDVTEVSRKSIACRCSRRKSSINIAQWGVVRLVEMVKGTEWSRRVALHKACMGVLVLVHTGTRIHWDAHQTFFCTKVRGRGESKQILREYGFKRTSKITDDP